MLAAKSLRHVGRYSCYVNAASDAVTSIAFCDTVSPASHLQTCLQFGDAATSLNRFASVSAVLFRAELSAQPALLSVLRSALPPCILPCVNRHCCVPHTATLPFFQPTNSLSFSLQSVPASRLRSCLQFGDAATSLNCFATVSAALSSVELSCHPALLSALRSVFPLCIQPCVNRCHVVLQLALIASVQPANSLSLTLQSVSSPVSFSAISSRACARVYYYHTRSLIGNCGVTFVARQIPMKTMWLAFLRFHLQPRRFHSETAPERSSYAATCHRE